MLIFNSDLITLRQQEEAERRKLAEIEAKRKTVEDKYRENIEEKEQQLIKQVANLYANQNIKFSARLSEDFEFVEVYSPSSKIVAQFTKLQTGQIRPIGQINSCENKQEDLILSRTKVQLYSIIENIFR